MCADAAAGRGRALAPALSALALLWVLGGSAPADGGPPPEAVRLFGECVVVFEAGQLEAARACFERVQAVYPSSVVLSNLGRVEERLGHLPEAYDAYRRATEDESRSFTADEKREVRRRVDRLAGRVGVLRVRVAVPVATLTIDGQARRGPAAGVFAVAPGTHGVRVEAPLYRPWSTRVTVAAGQTLELTARLEAAGQARPMAEVAWPESAAASAASRGGGSRLGAWLATGAGVALVGTGAAMMALWVMRAGDANALLDRRDPTTGRPVPFSQVASEYEGARSDVALYRGLAIGLYAAGVIAAGVGTYLFLRAGAARPGERRQARRWLRPAVAPGAAALWAGLEL